MDEMPQILIVEDDAGVAKGLVNGLKQAGFRTSLAINGEQGLKRILDESFDLVLLDLMLPERTGFEVLEAMCTRDLANDRSVSTQRFARPSQKL